jgi:methionyl-tRNA formyltransferase
MRYIYMGTPRFAAIILEDMIQAGHPPVGVMTQVDQPSGRGRKVTAPPVKLVAEKYGIPVRQPAKIGEPTRDWMRSLDPEICLVAAYGKILRTETLYLAKHGTINAHGSLLPLYRGAAPIAWALINGDEKSGVTIMHVDEGSDTGDVIISKAIPIASDETAGSLFEKLAKLSGPLFIEAMELLAAGTAPRIKQSDMDIDPVIAPKLTKETGNIDWTWSADKIVNLVKGTNPWPAAQATMNERRIKILAAEAVQIETDEEPGEEPGTVVAVDKEGVVIAAGEDAVRLKQVQVEGKRAMGAFDCACGQRLSLGDRLGNG